MAEGTGLAEQVTQAWEQVRAHWSGGAAESYYRTYLLPMQEDAAQFDAACSWLERETGMLAEELADIERNLDD